MNPLMLKVLSGAFGTLVVLQALLGGWLFIHNVGLGIDAINAYYREKSLEGLLEVIIPHTLLVSVVLMAILHFLTFIEAISEQYKNAMIHALFALFLLDQFSPVAIALGHEGFGYLKLFSFVGFEVILAAVWIIIFKAVLVRAE